MIHRRCDQTIQSLREELRRAHALNSQLVDALAESKGVVLTKTSSQEGDVYYMDEERERELEENGSAPS